MKFGNINGQGLAEIQNFNIQNLPSAPTTNVMAGRFYFSTANNTVYVYNGTEWVDALNQGLIYNFSTGLTEDPNTHTVTLNLASTVSFGGVIIGSNINVANDGTISVSDASTSEKGVIEIATDTEASTGTSETLAINPKQLATKIGYTDLSIASASTNYLTYNNANGQFGANVDTTVTASSTNLVTSGAVQSAIDNALTGALKYQGIWTATSQTDYSSITLPVKKGYMYAVSGNATVGGVEWNSGDYLVINKDIAVGGTITSADVEKIDNTEASDIVRLAATQTLTNKTIDADDNTISNLETDNFKSGVVRTSTDGIRTPSNASDTAIVTEKNIATVLASKTYTENNITLTPVGNICTWTVTHNMNNLNVAIHVYEITTGEEIMYDRAVLDANTVLIKLLSTSNIVADTYKVVVLC